MSPVTLDTNVPEATTTLDLRSPDIVTTLVGERGYERPGRIGMRSATLRTWWIPLLWYVLLGLAWLRDW